MYVQYIYIIKHRICTKTYIVAHQTVKSSYIVGEQKIHIISQRWKVFGSKKKRRKSLICICRIKAKCNFRENLFKSWLVWNMGRVLRLIFQKHKVQTILPKHENRIICNTIVCSYTYMYTFTCLSVCFSARVLFFYSMLAGVEEISESS